MSTTTPAEKQRKYRDRQRGGPPREPAPCGTLAAFRRHQRHGEQIDDACRQAYNAAHRAMYAQRLQSRRMSDTPEEPIPEEPETPEGDEPTTPE